MIASKKYQEALNIALELIIIEPKNDLVKEYIPVLRERIQQLNQIEIQDSGNESLSESESSNTDSESESDTNSDPNASTS